MTWKVEKWSKDIFPSNSRVYKQHQELSPLELVILSSSIIDLALAELITLRLRDDPSEVEAFMGLNEDGRAPCASFGARIQAAYLLGIITKYDAEVFRCLKRLRNIFAHRTDLDFRNKRIRSIVQSLYDAMETKLRREGPCGDKDIKSFPRSLRSEVTSSDAILYIIRRAYQLHFKNVMSTVPRVC